MGNKYTVDEAFKLFKDYGITSNIAVVRRWIRSGEIHAVMENKQSGYRIEAKEIQRFIEERSLQYWRNKAYELERENKQLKQTLSNIDGDNNITKSNITENSNDVTESNIIYSNIDELLKMNRDDLRKLCKNLSIVGYSRMTKEEMVNKIISIKSIEK